MSDVPTHREPLQSMKAKSCYAGEPLSRAWGSGPFQQGLWSLMRAVPRVQPGICVAMGVYLSFTADIRKQMAL